LSYSPVGHLAAREPQGCAAGQLRPRKGTPSGICPLPVGRSRNAWSASPSATPAGASMQRRTDSRRSHASSVSPASEAANDVVQATRLPFDPGSPTAGCAIRDGRRPTWRSFGARASRTLPEIGRQKPELNTSIHFFSVREESFSLRRGLDSVSSFFKLGITSLRVGRSPPETTKATRWVALDWLGMRLET